MHVADEKGRPGLALLSFRYYCAVSKSRSRARRWYLALPAVPREFATLALMLLLALTLLPLAIWAGGRIFLGDYQRDALGTSGGPLALLGDYVAGIVGGSPGHCIAFLGPYMLLVAFRTGRAIYKK